MVIIITAQYVQRTVKREWVCTVVRIKHTHAYTHTCKRCSIKPLILTDIIQVHIVHKIQTFMCVDNTLQ
jgi:hypothetical protein